MEFNSAAIATAGFGVDAVAFEPPEKKKEERTREARSVTIDPSTICQDGTDKGLQVWNTRGHFPELMELLGKG